MKKESQTWKQKALEKQLKFKTNLHLTKSGMHGKFYYDHILADEDAAKGANFYCFRNTLEFDKLKLWASKDRGKRVNFLSNGYKNMLRSEHIPYNVFYPLHKLNQSDPAKLNKLFEQIINVQVDCITKIKIEFAGGVHKLKLLDDNTSFDAYIEFKSNNVICGIGIEVKYTEQSYPYGNTEKRRLFDNSSEYLKLAKRCNYFKNPQSQELKSKKLKQAFRNHLLGIKMEELHLIDKFYSVHFYPEENTYQNQVTIQYLSELNNVYKNRFIPLTFTNFVRIAKESNISDQWLDYFESRY